MATITKDVLKKIFEHIKQVDGYIGYEKSGDSDKLCRPLHSLLSCRERSPCEYC